jgi:hypothetical protein
MNEKDAQAMQNLLARYLESGRDEDYEGLETALYHLLRNNDTVWIDGQPIAGHPGHYNPAGMTTSSGRFYLLIFTSRKKAEEAGARWPMNMELRTMVKALPEADCAGLAVDFVQGQRCVLFSSETMLAYLHTAEKAEKRLLS